MTVVVQREASQGGRGAGVRSRRSQTEAREDDPHPELIRVPARPPAVACPNHQAERSEARLLRELLEETPPRQTTPRNSTPAARTTLVVRGHTTNPENESVVIYDDSGDDTQG